MKQIFTSIIVLLSLLLSINAIAQPLPCPPLNSTSITGTGGTTICNGGCTTVTATGVTSVRSTTAYTYSTIPYLPTTFTGGTGVLLGVDDQYSGVVPLPFDFCFYGVKYRSCVIGANGEICFNTALAGGGCPWSIPGPIPGTAGSLNAATLNTIMGAYYDIDPSEGGTIQWAVYGTAPCRTFVVSWNVVPLFTTGMCPGQLGIQQIVLYESTYAIDIFLHTRPVCTAWNNGWATLGLVDATGANFNIPADKNASTWTAVDSGYRFTPNGPAFWTYRWTDPSGTVVATTQIATVCPVVPTTYTITGVASSNCDSYTVRNTVFVAVGANPNISHFRTVDQSKCRLSDGSITLYGLVPGRSDTIYYKFNGVLQPYVVQTALGDSSVTITGLCHGIYDSFVVKVGFCHTNAVGPITINRPNPTIASVDAYDPNPWCVDNGSLVLNGLDPGITYTVTYTKGGVPQPPIVAISSSTGTITISGLGIGTYTNIIGRYAPCLDSCVTPPMGPYVLAIPPPPNYFLTSSTSPSQCGYCDGTITLKGMPPGSIDTIKWMKNAVSQPPVYSRVNPDSTIVMLGMCAGNYTTFSINIGQCPATVLGSALLVNPPLKASFNTIIHYGCHGDTVTFTNNSSTVGALYYAWDFGDGSPIDSSANPVHVFDQGYHSVSLTATNHFCWDKAIDTFTLFHPIHAGFLYTPDILCQGNTVNFVDTAIGLGLTYAWSFGNGAVAFTKDANYLYKNSGVYTVRLIVTDFVPCSDTATHIVLVDSLSPLNILLTDSVLCKSTYATMTGNYTNIGLTELTWNFDDGNTIKNVNPVTHAFDAAKIFTVTLSAKYRVCKDTMAQRVVVVYPMPTINLGQDTTICSGSEPFLLADKINNANPNAHWLWSTGQTTSSIGISEPGTYTAKVTIDGCSQSYTVVVESDCYLNIPNIFTPNGDGLNDYFMPRQLLTKGLSTFNMNIFNRWGELVYKSTSIEGRGWDGRFNDVNQPEGVYVYTIDCSFKDGQHEHHQGNLTLLR